MTQLQQHLSGLFPVALGLIIFRWADPISRTYPFYTGFDKSLSDYYGAIALRVGGVILVLIGLGWLLTGW